MRLRVALALRLLPGRGDGRRAAADVQVRHAGRVAVRHRDRRAEAPRADLVQDDFEVFDNEKPQPLIFFDNEDPADYGRRHARHERQHDADDRPAQAGRRKSSSLRLLPADKARVGAFNDKIQFSARFTNNRDRAGHRRQELDYGNGTRLWDALARQPRRTERHRRTPRRPRLHRRRRHREPHSSLGKVIDRARAEEVMIYAIGLESHYFNGQRMVVSKPDGGLRKLADETGGGYFELTRRASSRRPSRASRRSCTASTCSASRRPCSTAASTSCRAREEAGHDRARAPKLSGRRRQARRLTSGRHPPHDALTEQEFRVRSDEALEQARRALLPLADQEGFEIEFSEGTLNLMFEEPSEARFVVVPTRRCGRSGCRRWREATSCRGRRRPRRSRSTARRSRSCSNASRANSSKGEGRWMRSAPEAPPRYLLSSFTWSAIHF